MAACGSLQHIFDKPLETPKPLFDSLPSWNEINPIDDSSSTSSDLDLSPPLVTNDNKGRMPINDCLSTKQTKQHQDNTSFSTMSSERLSMCTEGLGSESFDDVEESKNEDWKLRRGFDTETKHGAPEMLSGGQKRCRISGSVEFPPPISSIGSSGKPWVCLKSYRDNGRFVLKEVGIQTHEFLHACREDGRLKLQFIPSDDETENEE